jgi:hypothetical protein
MASSYVFFMFRSFQLIVGTIPQPEATQRPHVVPFMTPQGHSTWQWSLLRRVLPTFPLFYVFHVFRIFELIGTVSQHEAIQKPCAVPSTTSHGSFYVVAEPFTASYFHLFIFVMFFSHFSTYRHSITT